MRAKHKKKSKEMSGTEGTWDNITKINLFIASNKKFKYIYVLITVNLEKVK